MSGCFFLNHGVYKGFHMRTVTNTKKIITVNNRA